MDYQELKTLLDSPEGTRIEFKSASHNYPFDNLVKYCVALANEGGGHIILGVSDKRPRQVVGTDAFPEPGRTEAGLFEQLHHRISIEECYYKEKRVLVVHVPARLPGTAWQCKGAYLMRAGDALLPMADDQLRRIFEETSADFSAEICQSATIDDIDPAAVETLRRLWQQKSGNQDFARKDTTQLLADSELVTPQGITYAALILLGRGEALGKHLGQAEVVFEYRSNQAAGPAANRHEFRQGFLLVLDEIWRLIELRNDKQHFQQRLFVWDVPTFNERAVREGVLNAVVHRDYRSSASVFIRQYPQHLEIVSPGGFPAGINVENILREQKPRNRRIAEVLAKCGLVERAGQGMDLIFRECIRQSKPLPDFTNTSANSVWLTLHGKIQDEEFLRFLEEIGQERVAEFCTDDLLVIDSIHRGQRPPAQMKPRVEYLLGQGIIERIGRGRGGILLLSSRFYRHLGKTAEYTRKRGLDRETNKSLLLKHLQRYADEGSPISELQRVLPAQSREQLRHLLEELRDEEKARLGGIGRGARWYYKADD